MGHDLHLPRGNQVSWPSRQQSHSARKVKHEHLFEAAADSSAPITSSSRDTTADLDGEINIRGIAGPCVVVATNFAPGTTAADIESAMLPSAGEMQSCKIVAYSPSLTAELAFADRANAENVIAAFNNKKVLFQNHVREHVLTCTLQADGRVLQVYMKRARSNSPTDSPTPKAVIGSRAPRADLIRSDLPPSELPHLESLRSESMRPEPITPDPGRSGSYDYQRERSDMNRRRAEPEIQDGSYGFESGNVRMDVDVDNRRDSWRNGEGSTNVIRARDDRRLYSDDLYPRHRGRVFR